MASKKVQKYRSRKKAASRSWLSVSTASSSRQRSMAFSLSALPSSTVRTIPSVRLLARPKGSMTRCPGRTVRFSGT